MPLAIEGGAGCRGKSIRPDPHDPIQSAYTAHGLSALVQRATTKLGAKQYTAHGLRCNAAIALAEADCTVHQIMAITGHKTYKLAMHYSQRAGQKKLARQAIDRLEVANLRTKRQQSRG